MASLPSINTAIVYDKSEHYYAIGNTPPQQLIPPNVRNPKILYLAAGDLRGCFFSVSRSPKDAYDCVSFVINDNNPAILARNILLLALALRPDELGCTSLDLWAVWYSLYISIEQWDCVCGTIRRLLQNDRLLQELQVSLSPSTLQACREVWTMWINMDITNDAAREMQYSYTLPRVQEHSDNSLESFYKASLQRHFVRQGYVGVSFASGHFKDSVYPVPGLHLYEHEILLLLLAFDVNTRLMCTNVEDSALVVNSTLFMDPSRYNLHYATAFYESFHLWRFRPKEESLQDYCKSQHAEWVTDLQASAQKIRFEFVLGDCNAICMNSPHWFQTFDVIDTSNVCDHVGLPGLLLTCRPLVVPHGIMFTTSMTSHVMENEDSHYLKKALVADNTKWADIYGWSCHGHEVNGVKAINIEWPLVSPNAPTHYQWIAQKSGYVSEESILIVMKALLNPYYAGPYPFYSVGVVILLLRRNVRSPLEFLRKFQSEIPEKFMVELQLWLEEPKVKGSKWVEFDLKEVNLFSQIRQPCLRVQGSLYGGEDCFSILMLERSVTGKTVKVKFLAPTDLDISSVQLYSFNTKPHHVLDLSPSVITECFVTDITPFSDDYKKGTVLAPVKYCPYSVKGLTDWTCTSKLSRKTEPWEYFNSTETLSFVGSQIMMKREMLLSRSKSLGGISDEIPFLSIKELILDMTANGKNRGVVLVEDGAGTVPTVIVKEGVYQSESTGVPILCLTVFFPFKSFSSRFPPKELENHHSEDPNMDRCVLSYNTRKCLKHIVETLAGEFKEVKNSWGMPGIINKLLFPVFFPTRCEKMAELHWQMNIEARLGILRVRNDRAVEKVIALKEHGNSLLKNNKFEEAIFAYTLAALKIESEDVDDRNKTIVELTAQCHSNIALAKLSIATNHALADGVRSCSYSICLMPMWGKPYYRRGLCYEKQGLIKLAIQDFKKAIKLCPNDNVLRHALVHVQQSKKKKSNVLETYMES